ncbi:hypothetical protein O1W68_20570 [Rhodococcus sp. H36-A4]|uniref:hypothetical protein n=1 Tax=Rhodococcus sp. H36-A4 TaxID=3004353 RepID=UPI0022AF5EB8|nr:hypothetical protein [Rhodococcus sp. H36-A4]MCZ4080345.1 hypothetical protein [Rhodococcus sp. H36-A4]
MISIGDCRLATSFARRDFGVACAGQGDLWRNVRAVDPDLSAQAGTVAQVTSRQGGALGDYCYQWALLSTGAPPPTPRRYPPG